VRSDRAAALVAVVAGAIFLVFGIGKFVNHGAELDAFRGYGLPLPEVTVIAVGALETVGGALLIARRLVGPVAALMAGNMAVAIAVSGIGKGEVVPSLTLAPALLAGMIYLLAHHPIRPARPR
jgi:uncharacterized membrane protein YphA (DoxX/SURF4 family)